MPAIDPPASRKSSHRIFDSEALDRIITLLTEESMPNGGLPLEAIDGLFSAAWISPGEPVTFEEVLPFALGDAAGNASEELMQLLNLLWHSIGQRIIRPPQENPGGCIPLVAMPEGYDGTEEEADEEALMVGAAWALGFLMTFNLRTAEWDKRMNNNENVTWDLMDVFSLVPRMDDAEDDLFDDGDLFGDDDFDGNGGVVDEAAAENLQEIMEATGREEDLAAYRKAREEGSEQAFLQQLVERLEEELEEQDQLVGDDDGDSADDEDLEVFDEFDEFDDLDENTPPTFQERISILGALPDILHDLHLLSIEERTPRTPAQRENVPGRNDPCPCGSGQKYKKCHGDPSRLN